MTFHAPRKIKPSVGLLADEFPEPWLRISQVEAEQGDLRGRHRPPLRAIPGFSLPTSRLDRRVELPTIGIVSIRGVALCPLSEAYDDLRRFWPTCTYGGHGPTSARFLRAQLDGQRDYEPVVAALENVLVESPRLGELHGVLEHLRRVRLEDQLLAPAEGGIIEVALERRWDVSFPQAHILVRVPLQGLLGPLERSEEPTESPSADRRRHPKRDHELALRQLAQPFGFRDRDLGAGPYEDGVTSHAVEVGHDPTHTGARVASGAPLAGRVSDLLLSDEGEILRALAVLVALMAGDRVHDVGEHAWLEALVPEIAFLQRDPLVQAREVRHYVDGSWFIARSTHVSITSLSPPLYLFESTRP